MSNNGLLPSNNLFPAKLFLPLPISELTEFISSAAVIRTLSPHRQTRDRCHNNPSEIDTKYNEGMSSFHALVTSVTRRFHNGLFLGGNYMYSHALSNGSVGTGDADAAQNIACFRCDYASSDFEFSMRISY
jgi:hypothetical protein